MEEKTCIQSSCWKGVDVDMKIILKRILKGQLGIGRNHLAKVRKKLAGS